ncbi:MAG: hypothetical protein CL897_04305 [Dehalococcoidia bacterium]|nr:hypothetical protein [Dehalococcoidia bacterium]
MRPSMRMLFPLGLALLLGVMAAIVFLLDDGASSREAQTQVATPSPDASETSTTTPSAPLTPSPTTTPVSPTQITPTKTPVPSPTPTNAPTTAVTPTVTQADAESVDGRPARCRSAAGRSAEMVANIEEVMTDYEGVWGLALIDLDCGSSVVVRPQHAQYPASAGKIVILTASLRAVQDGLLEFESIEEDVQTVLHYSLDKNTDEIASLITPEQVGVVMARAGVSQDSYLHWHWRDARFTPHDLALVWASILRGEQLDKYWTGYLLQLASEVVLPENVETFPADFGIEGYQYGQKAGYWTPENDSHHLVAAGYIRPEDGISTGFTFAFLIQTWEEDLFEPQRRAVFPLVRDFVVMEVERNR